MAVTTRTWSVRKLVRTIAVALLGFLAVPLYTADAEAQRRKVIRFDEDALNEDDYKITGNVHKPELTYFLTRQEQEDLETLQLKESFIPKIVKSVQKAPF
jgi:hypothetical protein